MLRRMLSVTLVVLLLGTSLSVAGAQNDRRCFPETGRCISGVIRAYWEANGGLPVFGYPITNVRVQTNADGFTGPTQWFQRDRLEDHTAEGKGVLAGRLGADKLAQEKRPWEALPKVEQAGPGCLLFKETGHSLCPPFRAYWEQNGGLPRFGYPITEPAEEENDAGFTGTFQWFERRRLELHPENQPPSNILAGLLGKEVLDAIPPTPPFALRGRGSQQSQPFELADGLYLVESRYIGPGTFVARLLNAEGAAAETLANETGDANVTHAMYLVDPATFTLDVQSNGQWEVVFRQPTPAEIANADRVPATLTGSGKRTLFLQFGAGPARFEYTHTGQGNFVVRLNDLTNDTLGVIADERGNASGSKVQRIERSGSYMLEIEADGIWSIIITQ